MAETKKSETPAKPAAATAPTTARPTPATGVTDTGRPGGIPPQER